MRVHFNYQYTDEKKTQELHIMESIFDPFVPTMSIKVENLPEVIGSLERDYTFRKFGDLHFAMVNEGDKNSKRHGYVQYREIADAENACKKLNGLEINGELVHITQMRNRAPAIPAFIRKSDKNKRQRRRN